MDVNDVRISRRGMLALGAAGLVGTGAVLLGRPQQAAADGSRTAQAARAGVWEVLATHPQAAAQPTAVGRAIVDLELFGNALYAGFGDYDKNTGPIAINPYDLGDRRFRGVKLQAYTHQIGVWRTGRGTLVAPNIDPLGDVDNGRANDPNAGFDWIDGETWKHRAIGTGLHVFDWAAGDGSTFAVGSAEIPGQGGGPVVWRRIGTGPWNRSFGGDSDPRQNQDRYYWIAVVDGVPFVQARGTGRVAPMRRLDVAKNLWTVVPAITDEFHPSGQPRHVQVCQGAIISLTGERLRVFTPYTGAPRRVASPDGSRFVDLYVDGAVLWVLTQNGVFRSTDLGRTFQRKAGAPVAANALAARTGEVFVGTTDSRLLRHAV